MSRAKIRICFVCLGNICRSPTAEGVMRQIVDAEGLADTIEIDSAGTAAYHVGERADERAREAALRRGVVLESRARQFVAEDFDRFDYVLAMDIENLENLEDLRRGRQHGGFGLLRSHDPKSTRHAEVPDPYYGGEDEFEVVLDQCEAACRGLLETIRTRAGFE